ncbi:putative Late embryogenesis abundant protein, LEA_2 subgroup [Helianthus debilis subsp. tardiflorus]
MADPENQTIPIAPAGAKSDGQPYTTITPFTKPKHQKTNKSLVYILATIVFISTIFLIFASVFLRVDNPHLRIRTVSIQNFELTNTNNTNSTSHTINMINITMLTEITVDNGNFGRFVFDNCAAVLLYGNATIGGGYVSGGRVGAKNTRSIGVVMRVGYENLNVSSGMDVMEVVSYAKMKGRVHVMKIVDRKKTIEMNCTVSFNLTNRSFVSSLCR